MLSAEGEPGELSPWQTRAYTDYLPRLILAGLGVLAVVVGMLLPLEVVSGATNPPRRMAIGRDEGAAALAIALFATPRRGPLWRLTVFLAAMAIGGLAISGMIDPGPVRRCVEGTCFWYQPTDEADAGWGIAGLGALLILGSTFIDMTADRSSRGGDEIEADAARHKEDAV
jgi:hypothetical protein